jgi:hypothetical protein
MNTMEYKGQIIQAVTQRTLDGWMAMGRIRHPVGNSLAHRLFFPPEMRLFATAAEAQAYAFELGKHVIDAQG